MTEVVVGCVCYLSLDEDSTALVEVLAEADVEVVVGKVAVKEAELDTSDEAGGIAVTVVDAAEIVEDAGTTVGEGVVEVDAVALVAANDDAMTG